MSTKLLFFLCLVTADTFSSVSLWTHQNPKVTTANFKSLYLHESENNIVIAVGEHGSVVRSIDTGNTFKMIRSGFTGTINSVSGNGDFIMAACDSGIILYSFDNGLSWRCQIIDSSININGIVTNLFIDYAIAVGEKGSIYRLTIDDTLIVSTKYSSGTTVNLNDAAIQTDDMIWVCGDSGVAMRFERYSSWEKKTTGTTLNLRSIDVDDNEQTALR
jgi:photosystem II stability/assembly factor-like uncharacterized protein